jgi:DNA-binding beta-propeller fold protein YncE
LLDWSYFFLAFAVVCNSRAFSLRRVGSIFLAILMTLSLGRSLAARTAHAGGVIPIASGFNRPFGVAVDGSGNVFVAGDFDNVVKEIVAVGGVVSSRSTVNTIGSGFSNPAGVAVDGNGNVFVADLGNGAVKEIVAVGGAVSSSSTATTIGSAFPLAYSCARVTPDSDLVFLAMNPPALSECTSFQKRVTYASSQSQG